MSKASARSTGPNMTKSEIVAGLLYLPVYVVLLSVGLRCGAELLGLTLTDLQLNVCYFVINTLLVWVIFRRFLSASFRSIRFWDTVQAVILGFVLYQAGNVLLSFLLNLLSVSVISHNDQNMQALTQDSFLVSALLSVFLAPVIEEVLARGLIFGVLRRKSRVAAYAMSILFFSFIHVWQYIPTEGLAALWPAAAVYLPASVALCWTYEKAGTVWAAIFLHMACNAVALGLM